MERRVPALVRVQKVSALGMMQRVHGSHVVGRGRFEQQLAARPLPMRERSAHKNLHLVRNAAAAILKSQLRVDRRVRP